MSSSRTTHAYYILVQGARECSCKPEETMAVLERPVIHMEKWPEAKGMIVHTLAYVILGEDWIRGV
jgi:hypothetical protein